MAKSGKTSYSPALRLKMKMDADKRQVKPQPKCEAQSIKELMGER